MRVLMALPWLCLVGLAGCLGSGPDDAPLDDLSFLAPVPVSTEQAGSEPVISVAGDGTMYVEGVGGGSPVWRSDDGGQTWTDVTPPTFDQTSNDGWVEVAEDGTVYAANVLLTTYHVYRSDDRGDTWTPLNVPRVPLLMHRHWIVAQGDTLHMAYEAFPLNWAPFFAGQTPLADLPPNPNQGMVYTGSEDRGATWSVPVFIDTKANFAGQSNLAVSADGQNIAVARYEEDRPTSQYTYADGRFYMVVSDDGGSSWHRREAFDVASPLASIISAVAFDPSGTLYFVWSDTATGQSQIHIARSQDLGASWSEPSDGPCCDLQAVPFAAARGDGALDLAWYSADATGAPGDVDAAWNVSFARVTGADTDHPSWQVTRLTDDPVHHGNICVKGPGCDSSAGDDRRLLDYLWLDHDPDGRAHVVWASTEWDQGGAFAVVALERARAPATR